MADVKWIKITTDIFDDEKILLIESLPDAYAIITVWFKLLCLAGKQNNSGVFMMGRIPYTDKMLATIFRMKETTVTMALQTFEQFGMIEIVDGVITIPNWEKHQSLDQLEQAKENTRKRVAKHREKQKLLAQNNTVTECNADVTLHVTQCNGDRERIEEDKEIDKEIDKKNNKKKTTPEKQKRGEFQNVLLTAEEEDKLIEEYGMVFAVKAITFLDEYIEETGYKRKNHYLCIKRWVIDAVKEKEEKAIKKGESPKVRYGNFDVDDAITAALERTEAEIKRNSKTAGEDEEIRKRAEALKNSFSK